MRRPQFNIRLTDEDRDRLKRLKALKVDIEGITLSDADLLRAGLKALEREYAQQAKKGKA